MGSLSVSVKKFMGNKNTVTLVGVLIALLVLYFGYQYRVNGALKMVDVPYAAESIEPKTKITKDMIETMQVPSSMLDNVSVYTNSRDIVGKYSNYNTSIPKGSMFFTEAVVEESTIPDSMFYDVPEGYNVDFLDVDIESTYGNSIMPENVVNIYVKYVNNDKISYGKFIENVEVLAVKDASGLNVFDSVEEVRTPSYIYMSMAENKYLLFRMSKYVRDYFADNSIEIVISPNTVEYKPEEKNAVKVSSETITNFILERVEKIDKQNDELNSIYEEIRNGQ